MQIVGAMQSKGFTVLYVDELFRFLFLAHNFKLITWSFKQ